MAIVSRRMFLAATLAGCGALGGAAYMRLWEPNALELSKTSVQLSPKKLLKPLRLLHLSDFHASDVVPLSYLREAVGLSIAAKPDLIVITGDFITRGIADFAAYSEILKMLSAAAPCFAVAGNHDGGDWAKLVGGYPTLEPLEGLLEASGITLLENEARQLKFDKQKIWLVGMGDLWAGDLDPMKAFDGLDEETELPVLALTHNPDSKAKLMAYPWDLLLCGHTHGGQLVIPLCNYRPFVPVVDRRYVEGLYRIDKRQIYITRGVGNLHGLRFNCPPEASMLELA